MTEPTAKQRLRALTQAAIERVEASGQGTEPFRGVAYYDTAKDEVFTSLDAFTAAETAIASRPLVQERYGTAEARRLTLQFVYEGLARLSKPVFDEQVFDALWDDFSSELGDPEWVYRGVANVRWFKADEGRFDLVDGVSIRHRSFEELSALGFSEGAIQALSDDWAGFGASSYVMVVESRVDKSPDNVILGGLGTEWTNAQRALGALRLLAPGDISIGRMWLTRHARFNVGLGGVTAMGFSIPAIGSDYHLTESIVRGVPELYGHLRHLEEHGYGAAPGNLDLALRSFMATYDRWPPGGDSHVLDAITALEAALGSGIEIAFKLSFRTASILGSDEAQRVAIFADMKAYYDLRSRLVHGEALKEKHRALLNDTERLRHLVRELLRGFVHLAIRSDSSYGKQFFQERLDAALLVESERAALRTALGLD